MTASAVAARSRGRGVARVCIEAASEGIGQSLLPTGLELQAARGHRRAGGHDREPPPNATLLGLVVLGNGREGRTEGFPSGFCGRPSLQFLEDSPQSVCVVGEDEVVLGREVRKERARREARCGGDLLDCGLVESVSLEQFDGGILQPSPPFELVPFSQSCRLGCFRHGRNVTNSA